MLQENSLTEPGSAQNITKHLINITSENQYTRREAVENIAKADFSNKEQVLTALLEDSSWIVRSQVLDALFCLDSLQSTDKVFLCLEDSSKQIRSKAVKLLVKTRNASICMAVLNTVIENRYISLSAFINHIGLCPGVFAVPSLEKIMDIATDKDKLLAIDVLNLIDDKSIVPVLQRAIQAGEKVRAKAIWVLIKSDCEWSYPLLTSFLNDKDVDIKMAVSEKLHKKGNSRATANLKKFMREGSYAQQRTAIIALFDKNKMDLDVLLAILYNNDLAFLHDSALDFITCSRSEKIIPVLGYWLEKNIYSDDRLLKKTFLILSNIGTEKALSVFRDKLFLVVSYKGNIGGINFVKSLALEEYKKAFLFLSILAEHDNEEIRVCSAETMIAINKKAGIQTLKKICGKDPNSSKNEILRRYLSKFEKRKKTDGKSPWKKPTLREQVISEYGKHKQSELLYFALREANSAYSRFCPTSKLFETKEELFFYYASALCSMLKNPKRTTSAKIKSRIKNLKSELIERSESRLYLEDLTGALELEAEIYSYNEKREVYIRFLRDALSLSLEHLTDNEKMVLGYRFGLIGRELSLEEAAMKMSDHLKKSITREKLRQMEAKALRKLRHPNINRHMTDFLDL